MSRTKPFRHHCVLWLFTLQLLCVSGAAVGAMFRPASLGTTTAIGRVRRARWTGSHGGGLHPHARDGNSLPKKGKSLLFLFSVIWLLFRKWCCSGVLPVPVLREILMFFFMGGGGNLYSEAKTLLEWWQSFCIQKARLSFILMLHVAFFQGAFCVLRTFCISKSKTRIHFYFADFLILEFFLFCFLFRVRILSFNVIVAFFFPCSPRVWCCQGIGRALLRRCVWLSRQEASIGAVYLHVITTNPPAHRFYESEGFVQVCCIDGTCWLGELWVMMIGWLFAGGSAIVLRILTGFFSFFGCWRIL